MREGKTIFKWIFSTGILCLIITLIFYILNQIDFTGPFFISGLLLTAISFQGFKPLKSYSYTMGILAAVTVSMYYPQYFRTIGSFDLKLLIIPLLQIIMFGMGSQLSITDFLNVFKMPKGVIVGIICHFSLMPLLGITIAKTFGFPPEIAAGIVLIGCAPSGLASNVMSFIAKANVPLSVTVTTVSTLLSPFLTPLLMKFLAGEFISIDFWKMMNDIINMIILPIVAGLLFNSFGYSQKSVKRLSFEILSFIIIVVIKNLIFINRGEIESSMALITIVRDNILFILLPVIAGIIFKKLSGGNKDIIDNALSIVSMLGIGIIITIITAAGRESLLQIGILLVFACFIHNTGGYILGYWISRLLRLDERSCRTVALEVGMQNGGLASGIALQMGKVATVGLAAAVFGPLMNVTGSSIASSWRGKPVIENTGIPENKL